MRKAKVGTFVKRSKCKAVRVRIAPDSTTLRCASVYFHVSRAPFRIFLFNSISNHVLVEGLYARDYTIREERIFGNIRRQFDKRRRDVNDEEKRIIVA